MNFTYQTEETVLLNKKASWQLNMRQYVKVRSIRKLIP